MSAMTQRPSAKGSMRRLWSAMNAAPMEFTLAIALGVLASASAIALLGTSAWLISRAAELPPVLTLSVAAVMVRAFALGRAIFRYLERIVGHDAAFRGLTRLRLRVYRSLEAITPIGLQRYTRGEMLARLGADVDGATDLPLRVILPWAQAVIVAAGTVAFLFVMLPSIGAVVGIIVLIALIITPWAIGRGTAHSERRIAPAKAHLAAGILDGLTGAAELDAFGANDRAYAELTARDAVVTSLGKREAVATGISGGIGVALQGAAVIAALVIAIPAVRAGTLPPVMLAVAALLPIALFDVLITLPTAAIAYHRLREIAARLAEIDAEVDVDASTGARAPEFTELTLHDVRAAWTPGTDVLHGIDLSMSSGQRIAIVGPSGSGKSTIAAVLMGFLPVRGEVDLSGMPLQDIDPDSLHERIGLLTQQAHIFDTTVAANLRLGDRDADDTRLMAALDRVHLGEWVRALPLGLETELGAFGMRMSGGQRQRLALARLLLARRALVILDEPTEHLDSDTAAELDRLLLETTQGTSTIIITHRLIGLDRVDRIHVLEAGRIVESGTHDELVRAGGWYARTRAIQEEQERMTEIIASLPIGIGVSARQ